ncbi:AAA-ATPase-like domain-containing protein [Mycena kentingensis (nom. inval.)]|nr:AAA-ATPase-like domain-containing protein [Mycena kentingensis (nom. inval.)]
MLDDESWSYANSVHFEPMGDAPSEWEYESEDELDEAYVNKLESLLGHEAGKAPKPLSEEVLNPPRERACTPPTTNNATVAQSSPGSTLSGPTVASTGSRSSSRLSGTTTLTEVGDEAGPKKDVSLSLSVTHSDDTTFEDAEPDPEPFLHVHNGVYACGGLLQRLHGPMDYFSDIATTPGVSLPIIFRRPHGWGIEIFAATFAARVDGNSAVSFFELRADDATEDSYRGLNKDAVLMLDLRWVEESGDVAHDLAVYVYDRCKRFLECYNFHQLLPLGEFLTDPDPAAAIVSHTVATARRQASRPILLIENFDALESKVPSSTLVAFFGELEGLATAGFLKGLVLFSDKDDGTLSLSATGEQDESPALMAEKKAPSFAGLQRAIDITHHPAFQTAVGYTSIDIWDLDEAFSESMPGERPPIFDILKDMNVRPVLFHNPEEKEELAPTDPLRMAGLDVHSPHLAAYPLEMVHEAFTKKYGLRDLTETTT